jgi:hypothetical protein
MRCFTGATYCNIPNRYDGNREFMNFDYVVIIQKVPDGGNQSVQKRKRIQQDTEVISAGGRHT